MRSGGNRPHGLVVGVETVIYLDTHVMVWLYAPRLDLLSERVREAIDEDDLLISPIVLLELDYLEEIGRIGTRAHEIYRDLHEKIGLRICELTYLEVVRSASAQTWTRDPFDRLIVGHAAHAEKPLVTRDESIRRHYDRVIW